MFHTWYKIEGGQPYYILRKYFLSLVKYNGKHYFALSTNSSISGTSLWTKIPLFIFAGSKAQFEIPMNATCKDFQSIKIYRFHLKIKTYCFY